jgi:dihydrofolate synthase/folylpolyglutamate synthase
MLQLVLPRFAAIVLTQYIHNPRATETEELTEVAREIITAKGLAPELQTAATPGEAWTLAQRLAGPDDLICITGSFFLAAELRPLVSPSTVETIATSASAGVPRSPSP